MAEGNGFSGFERAATGVAGLDEILGGGFPRNRMYLVEGTPGAGKTTLALQFLLEGARLGEAGVYATLSETEEELRDVAASHGWSLDAITICDLQTSEESLKADSQYTLFHPSEVELSETTRSVLDIVERVNPMRVVFDSLSEMRLLARDSLRYRRQILALKHYFTERQCTVLLLDYPSPRSGDFQLQSLTHGVLNLEHLNPEYGGQRRRLRVQKVRGVHFHDGYHDFQILTGGLTVYPRLRASEQRQPGVGEPVSSGLAELDVMLGGGLVRGTSTIVLGPSGVGKSVMVSQYVAAAARGESAAVFLFDESPSSWQARGTSLGLDISQHIASGRIHLQQVDPAELSPGELAQIIRHAVEDEGVRIVVIDSLNGYRQSMPEERYLTLHLHELLTYLNQQGVLTFLVLAQHGLVGTGVESPVELTYLSDSIILLRFFEAFGQIRQAISVVKKRLGSHERTVRELQLGPGIRVGGQIRQFQGILSGQLVYQGSDESRLLETTG
ncbi:MAG TPA: ATPase domain-containing protein [Thermoanaerobaculia bacterium]|nr:ATPase domain-containing protein [Thermoanaerobaculia bacterium]